MTTAAAIAKAMHKNRIYIGRGLLKAVQAQLRKHQKAVGGVLHRDRGGVQYAYNAQNELTSHTDGRNLATTRKVDGFGRVIQETSPDRGVRSYWYDLADNLTKVIDGDSEETDYTYDNAGRMLTTTFPGASVENVAYTYDSITGGNKGQGRLTGVTDETGSSSFTYDAQGRLTQDAKVIQGRTYTVAYQYDANGKVTQITLPSGRTVSYARASDGLVTGITTKETPTSSVATIASSVTYLPFGPVKSLSYGNGLDLTRTFDGNYWLSQIEVKTTGTTRLDLSYSRNANGQMEGITDNASTGRGAWHGYTDAGRLAYAVGPWSEWDYAYDGAGNMIERDKVVGGVKTYNYLVTWGTANRLGQVQNASTTPIRNLSYRLGGDLAQDQRVGGDTYDYYYNARKRLVVAKKNSADVGWYAYDAFGRRVARTTFSGSTVTTHYVFAPDGKLLAEHDDATGNVIKEYVWLGEMVVAMIDSSSGSPVTYFVHTGAMDEPLVLTDASKAKVWDAYVDPYGDAQTFGTPTATINLRLPGQYYQAETGLLQNWMRDYDPSLGRYIQVDPIGLAGGQNVYPYVDGRPTEFVDPAGLDWVYSQSAGIIQNYNFSFASPPAPISYKRPEHEGEGYSGHGQGVNNPTMQNVQNVGPIPQGCWIIGKAYDGKLGRPQMRLSPCEGTETFGRSAFLIHGDNSRRNRSASEGCIILPVQLRRILGASSDKKLWVTR